jgi:hypothetical protein
MEVVGGQLGLHSKTLSGKKKKKKRKRKAKKQKLCMSLHSRANTPAIEF